MPSYKRFSDNSVQSSSSYQVFNKDDIISQVPSPQQQQQQREHFSMQQKMQPPPEPSSINQMPIMNNNMSDSQILKQAQQDIRLQRSEQDQNDMNNYKGENVEEDQEVQGGYEITLEDLREMLPNSHEAHIRETHRLLQNESTLNINQAANLAEGNGCLMSGPNEMCPVMPRKDNFRQKGDCTGKDCDIRFNKRKGNVENFQTSSTADKIKQLGQIIFYSSTGCGFCNQSKQLFGDAGLIGGDVGEKYIKILENQPLPEGVRGYPHFVRGNKSHTGFPRTLDKFYDLMK